MDHIIRTVDDEITFALYEDALVEEEPWAIEAYEYRHPEAGNKTGTDVRSE